MSHSISTPPSIYSFFDESGLAVLWSMGTAHATVVVPASISAAAMWLQKEGQMPSWSNNTLNRSRTPLRRGSPRVGCPAWRAGSASAWGRRSASGRPRRRSRRRSTTAGRSRGSPRSPPPGAASDMTAQHSTRRQAPPGSRRVRPRERPLEKACHALAGSTPSDSQMARHRSG